MCIWHDEAPGGIAIFSDRNRGKIERIIAALETGLHVLADKPAIAFSPMSPIQPRSRLAKNSICSQNTGLRLELPR